MPILVSTFDNFCYEKIFPDTKSKYGQAQLEAISCYEKSPTPILLQPPFSWKPELPFLQAKHPHLPQSLLIKQAWPKAEPWGASLVSVWQLDVTPLPGHSPTASFYPAKSTSIQSMSGWFLEENVWKFSSTQSRNLLDCFFSAVFLHFQRTSGKLKFPMRTRTSETSPICL